MIFFLGTHHPEWLGRTTVPLFVSRRRLAGRRTFPRATGPWALDSGGFTELSLHGRWTVTAREYVAEVRRFRDEIGSMAWAAPQDWMCEEVMVRKTGLSIEEHQRRTLDNLLELRALAPDLPIVPVLQGWVRGHYEEHVEAYARAGVDLTREPVVGIGSVCRRQNTLSVQMMIANLAASGIRCHGFGFKRSGLRASHGDLVSADSLAWSYHARREPPRWECRGRHKNCANCLPFALEWREDTLRALERDSGAQLALAGVA